MNTTNNLEQSYKKLLDYYQIPSKINSKIIREELPKHLI